MEALELGSSGEESEEGECSSDGEDNPLSLLGIPLDSDRKQPELVEYRDENEIETGSEVEGDERDEGEKDERDGMDDAGDRILPEKLMLLGSSEALKGMLCNRHLRQLLLEIQESRDPQLSVQRAMNIPVFVEFADECLRVCGFHDNES